MDEKPETFHMEPPAKLNPVGLPGRQGAYVPDLDYPEEYVPDSAEGAPAE